MASSLACDIVSALKELADKANNVGRTLRRSVTLDAKAQDAFFWRLLGVQERCNDIVSDWAEKAAVLLTGTPPSTPSDTISKTSDKACNRALRFACLCYEQAMACHVHRLLVLAVLPVALLAVPQPCAIATYCNSRCAKHLCCALSRRNAMIQRPSTSVLIS
jgi:hypothetical protein